MDGGPECLEGLLEGAGPQATCLSGGPLRFLLLRGLAAFPDLYKPNQGVQGHLKFKKLASGATSLSLPPSCPLDPTSSSRPAELGPALGPRRTPRPTSLRPAALSL